MSSIFKGFLPWVLFSLLFGTSLISKEFAIVVALVSLVLLNHKTIRKLFVLDIGAIVFFLLMAANLFILKYSFITNNGYLLSTLSLAFIAWVSIIIKRPFTLQYASLTVSIEVASSKLFLPNIRFAVGLTCETDYCFFLDDDLTVRNLTLANFAQYASIFSDDILGLEGSILGDTETPYSNDKPIQRADHPQLIPVDVVIRTYFVPVKSLLAGFELQLKYPDLPRKSLDDVFLCLGNKYLLANKNYVIPVDKDTDLIELSDGGVGQSLTEDHYGNRNKVCKFLMNIYKV